MKEADYLRQQARECRSNARERDSKRDRNALLQLASYYEREATRLDTNTLQAMQYRY